MAVTYFPFNSIVVDGVPDRPANAENLAAYLAGFFSNGVLMQTDTALKVEASSGMNVQIHAGMGNINGKTILADAAEIITLDTASASLNRIDRVVFRLDEVNRLMEFDVLKGTPAASPIAPALTQGADVYELCLAEIRVPAGASKILASYITDTRIDAELCGLANIPAHMQDLEHGGTGISAESAEALLLALGGTSMKRLWLNASPTSTFASQNINLDLIPYNFVLAGISWGTTEPSKISYFLIKKGASSFVSINYVQSSRSRQIDVTDDRVVVGLGYTSSAAQDNNQAIPIEFYGIMGVQ